MGKIVEFLLRIIVAIGFTGGAYLVMFMISQMIDVPLQHMINIFAIAGICSLIMKDRT